MTSPSTGYDLVLRGGRIVDPSQALDMVGDVGFRAGRVAAVAASLAASDGTLVRDVKGLIVVPGLIDLHTHVY
jgi:dihydroorotase